MKIRALTLVVIVFAGSKVGLSQQPVSLRRAIELALSGRGQLAISQADERRTYDAYRAQRASYIPKVVFGSDIGYAYGFPLSLEGAAPTVFNVTVQSSVWNPAQQSLVEESRSEWSAARIQSRDVRAQVTSEVDLTYLELIKWESRLRVLSAESQVAQNIEAETHRRIVEGVEKENDQTQAELVAAEIESSLTEAKGSIEILQTRLSQLTGLPDDAIAINENSIPEFQPAYGDSVGENLAIAETKQNAFSKQVLAEAEHRALYPTADFAAQYGVINSSLTNFEQFFVPHTFRTQNVTFGLVVRLPFLDTSQRARASAADADAVRARQEIKQAKDKISLDLKKLHVSLDILKLSRRVADLRYSVSENDREAARIRMETGTGSEKELENASIVKAERSLERINVCFEVQRAEINLLRATGHLEEWALQ